MFNAPEVSAGALQQRIAGMELSGAYDDAEEDFQDNGSGVDGDTKP